MAAGTIAACKTNIAIAISGIAGPEGGTVETYGYCMDSVAMGEQSGNEKISFCWRSKPGEAGCSRGSLIGNS